MNERKIPLVSLFVSLIGVGVGYTLTNSVRFSFCTHDQYVCREFLNRIGDPLFLGMTALAVVFLVLVFVPRAWEAWKMFAIWFVPLAALVFIFYKDPGSMNLVSPYADDVFKWIGKIYVVISLVIIAIAGMKKKKDDLSKYV